MQVWKIECLLNENAKSDDKVIKDMAERMMVKFSKYWHDYSVILAIAAVLDPRLKFGALRFCYSKLDSSTCEEKLNHIKNEIYKLFEEYVKEASNEPSASSSLMATSTQQVSNSMTSQLMDAFDVSYLYFLFVVNN